VGAQSKLWYGVMLAPSLVLYLIAMIGETNRLPFDLPEAEGELVAGYMTEYSSMKFAWFFLAEYINMLNVSAVCATLFLGGWRAPWPLSAIGDGVLNTGYWTILWFLAKTWLLMFLFVWVRGTVVRFRYDQFMRIGWKGLLPVAICWIVALTAIRAVDQFTNIHFNQFAVPILSWSVVLFILIWYWPVKEPEPPGPPEDEAEWEEIDAFADGFPAPPLPGQKLPPSPRALLTVAAPPPAPPAGALDTVPLPEVKEQP
jgi:NADH-quinone oxidoreductase subunit H